MNERIRFTWKVSSAPETALQWDQEMNPELMEKIAEAFIEWERTLRERAAVHLLTENLGEKQAKQYRIRFEQKEESLPDEG